MTVCVAHHGLRQVKRCRRVDVFELDRRAVAQGRVKPLTVIDKFDECADIVSRMLEAVTCSPGAPAVAMRVRQQETDDEEEQIYRWPDYWRAA